MAAADSTTTRSWLASIDRASWTGLIASWFGWLFDGYETYSLVLIAGIAVRSLISPADIPRIPIYVSGLFAVTLVGWATGGLIAGVLADYIGRKRVLMYSIIAYAVFALLSAAANDYWWLLVARFFTGFGLGGEWGAGASLVGELWPSSIRGRVAGIFQSGFGVGFLLATLCWLIVGPLGATNWRIMLVLGFVPALFVLYIRQNVKNPEIWTDVAARRREVAQRAARNETLSVEERELTMFTFTRVFASPQLRAQLFPLLLMALTTLIGWWGVSTWVPQYAAAIARVSEVNPLQFATETALLYNVAGIIGYVLLGFIADAWGRKATIWFFYLGSLIVNPLFFLVAKSPSLVLLLAAINGFFTLGQISWLAVYLPELFPTAVRGTAISIVFNITRYLVAIATFYAGVLVVKLGGIAMGATLVGLIYILGLIVVPFAGRETKGQPLPS